jgi:hypothetical protein
LPDSHRYQTGRVRRPNHAATRWAVNSLANKSNLWDDSARYEGLAFRIQTAAED